MNQITTVNFIGLDWYRIPFQSINKIKFPITYAVYMFVLDSNCNRNNEILYCGSTNSISGRFNSHHVLADIKNKNRSQANIFLYFRDNKLDWKIESKLIHKYHPIYNRHSHRYSQLRIDNFWDEVSKTTILYHDVLI